MWVEWLNDNNIVSDLNTTFEESLNSGFYVINKYEYNWRKIIACMTKDGQYSFYFALENWKLEMLWNRKEVYENYTLEQTIEDLQWYFSFKHNYIPVYSYKKQELTKQDLEDVNKLESFLIELEREEAKGNVGDILNK